MRPRLPQQRHSATRPALFRAQSLLGHLGRPVPAPNRIPTNASGPRPAHCRRGPAGVRLNRSEVLIDDVLEQLLLAADEREVLVLFGELGQRCQVQVPLAEA